MSQSICLNWLHIVFSTKERYPFLSNKQMRSDIHAYLGGICREMKSPARIVGGTADHVHLLCRLSPRQNVSALVSKIKVSSTKWAQKDGGMLKKFRWQGGYAAFSVSPSRLARVHDYIANQEQHHRRMDFKAELVKFLKEYHADFDERYLWD